MMFMSEFMKESGNNKTIMNVREVAKYLRISEAKVYRLVKQGEIPAMRIGKAWRFRKDILEEWIRQNTEVSAEEIDANIEF